MDNYAKGFTLIELLIVIVLLGALALLGVQAFVSSQIKSRDAKRKSELRQISLALEYYYNDKGAYPDGDASGNIVGCGVEAINTCTWGNEWRNDTTGTTYMVTLPKDLKDDIHYYYRRPVGYTNRFQLYAFIEDSKDTGPGVNQSGFTGTSCNTSGTLCKYGISSSNTTP